MTNTDHEKNGWFSVGIFDLLNIGEIKEVAINGKVILTLRTENNFFAFEKNCPHMTRPLNKALVKGERLICIHHGVEMDLNSGRITFSSGFRNIPPLIVYQTKKEGAEIMVKLV